jgi:cold shock CspA family protein
MDGVVVRIMKEKHFGFIKAEGQDYFFHSSGLKNIKFDDLKVNQSVTFEPMETSKGFRAEDIYA